ncbi:hypothetical protein GCG54_00015589 [Colletotrichum gloeosporioides]|uniref:Uncharacterized protein n=1 Tax=Colletotrichum gloeosporioides TaxID=474922 RepID=A0A8H4CXZ4_COLGL|nr:uncharacterized protein GCG54_00015589 [Colletotrichum gloeosporioides]KAF3812039.1 hypothetical protein GCG54_00015589 [Colletotrichum gloeosporioides]
MLPHGIPFNIFVAVCVLFSLYQGWTWCSTPPPALVIEIRKPASTQTVTKSSETVTRICRAYAAILFAVPTNRPPSLYEYLHIAAACAPSSARSKSSSARRCSTHQIYLAVEGTLIEYFPHGGFFSNSNSNSNSNPDNNNRDTNENNIVHNNNAVVTALVTAILFDEDTRTVYDHLFEPSLSGGASDRIAFLQEKCGEAWR